MVTLDPKHHPQKMAEKNINWIHDDRWRKRLKRGKPPETQNSNADKTIAEWEEALNPDLTNELLSDSELRDLGDFL